MSCRIGRSKIDQKVPKASQKLSKARAKHAWGKSAHASLTRERVLWWDREDRLHHAMAINRCHKKSKVISQK